MRILLILASSLLLAGCKTGSMPAFPDSVKYYYAIDIRDVAMPPRFIQAIENFEDITIDNNDSVNCLKFDIVEKIPFKIRFISVVDIKECQMMGGFKVNDSVSIFNWMDDMRIWADDRKKCFK